MLVIATQLYHSFSYSDIPYDVDFTIPIFHLGLPLFQASSLAKGF